MELNSEQIVKALECCTSEFDECDQCPVPRELRDDCTCGTFVMKGVLALIRELTEENERLRESGVDYRNIPYIKAEAKADTVRKMQEKLKAEFKDCCRYIQGNREYFIVGEELIDRIAKELLEVE